MLWYVDTSAVVKLIVAEPESLALREWLLALGREVVACDLVRTELFQVVRRAAPELLPQNCCPRIAAPELMVQARGVLEAITIVQVSNSPRPSSIATRITRSNGFMVVEL
jgi:predicted nucleic acid-binding protein